MKISNFLKDLKSKDYNEFPFKNEFIILAIANIVDIITTIIALEFFDAVEINPLMSYLIGQGYFYFIIVKIFVMSLVLGFPLLHWLRTGNKIFAKNFWRVLCGIFIAVLIWNGSMMFIEFLLSLFFNN